LGKVETVFFLGDLFVQWDFNIKTYNSMFY
jgi:hypothetical protein